MDYGGKDKRTDKKVKQKNRKGRKEGRGTYRKEDIENQIKY